MVYELTEEEKAEELAEYFESSKQVLKGFVNMERYPYKLFSKEQKQELADLYKEYLGLNDIEK